MSGSRSFVVALAAIILSTTVDALPQWNQPPGSPPGWPEPWPSHPWQTTHGSSTLVPTPSLTASPSTSSAIRTSHSASPAHLSSSWSYSFQTNVTASGSATGTISQPAGTAPSSWSSSISKTASASSKPYPFPSSSANSTSVGRPTGTAVPMSTSTPDVIRGANIGGWLILEKWMDSDVFEGTEAVDQWTFDSTDGAEAKLQQHWSTYFTEADVQQIASYGINAIRVPIGYWAYDNTGTPYIQGADAYLEQAIGWARTAGLKVLVDCHGSPGSQNGFQNSGHAGNVSWQTGDNPERSITVLETMAQKYGAQEYADVVYAIELVNEEISWDQNNFTLTKSWAQEAYKAVRAAATNKDLIVYMHDGFMGPRDWLDVGATLNGNANIDNANFAIDTHLYQDANGPTADQDLDLSQHISVACNWTDSWLLPKSYQLPVIVGEFTAQIDICVNPDGTTVAGQTCSTDGCQCTNEPIADWNQPLVQGIRRFVEAQMDAFEHSARGWFIWSYSGPGIWGLDNAIEYGVIGSKVTDRMFPNQCGFSS